MGYLQDKADSYFRNFENSTEKIEVNAKIRKNDLFARISTRVAPNQLLQCMIQCETILRD